MNAAPSTAAAAAAAGHLELSRGWAATASRAAGVPPPLQLLPSLPHNDNPAWQRAPSFAAAAALLVPPVVNSGSRNGKAHVASAADLAAAAAVAQAAGVPGRAMWALARDVFFVYATPYRHVEGAPHRQPQLLPMTLANLPARDGCSESDVSPEAAARRRQAAALFHEVAADQRPRGLRLLGWMLSHLFRCVEEGAACVGACHGLQETVVLHGSRRCGSSPDSLNCSLSSPMRPAAGCSIVSCTSTPLACNAYAPCMDGSPQRAVRRRQRRASRRRRLARAPHWCSSQRTSRTWITSC